MMIPVYFYRRDCMTISREKGIKYKVGCLIEAAQKGEVYHIAHQCNCFNTMGAGIASLIAKAFPAAKAVDDATVKGDIRKLGHFTHDLTCDEENEDTEGFAPEVYNLYGQYAPSSTGVATDYSHLRQALRGMAFSISGYTMKVGLPKIGAGLGGGDWSIISKIIEEELGEFDVTIYVLDEKEIPSA